MECPNCKDVRFKKIAPCKICGYMMPELQQQVYQQQMMQQYYTQQGINMPVQPIVFQEPTNSPLSVITVIMALIFAIFGVFGILGILLLITTMILAGIDIGINHEKYKVHGSEFALGIIIISTVIHLIIVNL